MLTATRGEQRKLLQNWRIDWSLSNPCLRSACVLNGGCHLCKIQPKPGNAHARLAWSSHSTCTVHHMHQTSLQGLAPVGGTWVATLNTHQPGAWCPQITALHCGHELRSVAHWPGPSTALHLRTAPPPGPAPGPVPPSPPRAYMQAAGTPCALRPAQPAQPACSRSPPAPPAHPVPAFSRRPPGPHPSHPCRNLLGQHQSPDPPLLCCQRWPG